MNTSCTDILQQSRYHGLRLHLPHTAYLFILLFQLIISSSIINNLLIIQTCLRHRIRITNLGVYLLCLSFCNLIGCVCLELSIIADTQSVQPNILFDMAHFLLDLLNYCAMCCSSMIACERMLIECFQCPLYGTRKRACLICPILFVGVFLTQVPSLPSDSAINLLSAVPMIDSIKCVELQIVLSACIVQVISSLFVLWKISTRKMCLNRGERAYRSVWWQQVKKHASFFIPPLCYILCTSPWHLFEHFIYSCDRFDPSTALYLYLVLITIANIPFTMTFLIYIYPSRVYMHEYKKSLAVLMTRVFRDQSQLTKRVTNDLFRIT